MGRQRSSFEWLSFELNLTPTTVPYTRERGLWLSVLWQALNDLINDNKPNEQRRARQWFQDKRIYIGSFNWVCDVIGVSTEDIRTALENDFEGFKYRFLKIKIGQRNG